MSSAMANQIDFSRREKQQQPLKWSKRSYEGRLADVWKAAAQTQEVIRVGRTSEKCSQPHELAQIWDAIKASEWILGLEEDWNGEGAETVERATWERATRFLGNYAVRSWEKFLVIIDAPKIFPGPSGSIDLHWRTEEYELLVNIPADPEKFAEFYGDDYGNAHIKGGFDPTGYNLGLLSWLSEHC